MKLLLSGGEKTYNIADGICKALEASGDEILVVEYLDDIEEIFVKGDYFDKAIITGQSITRDYTIQDETEVRQRIYNFAQSMSHKSKKIDFVFLTHLTDLAESIHEETLAISRNSTVAMRTPPYTVKFMLYLALTDMRNLSSNIVYTPDLILNNKQETEDTDIFNDMDLNTESYVAKEVSNVNADLFDSYNSYDNISDKLDLNTGADMPDGFDEIPDGFDEGFGTKSFGDELDDAFNTESFDDTFNTESFNEEFDNSFEDDKNNLQQFTRDETIDLMDDIPFQQSSELPDYTVKEDMTNIYEEDYNDLVPIEDTSDINDNQEIQQNDAYIPGFDDSDYTDEIDTSFGDDLYAPEENNKLLKSDNYTNFNNGFGDDYSDVMEDNSNNSAGLAGLAGASIGLAVGAGIGASTEDISSVTNNSINHKLTKIEGFDDNDYDNYTNNTDDYMHSVEQSILKNESMEEFNDSYYNDETPSNNTLDTSQVLNQQPLMPIAEQGIKKKGFLTKLTKGKNEVNPNVEMNMQMMAQQQDLQNQQQMYNLMQGKVNAGAVKEALKPFAARGNSIVVTGCGGCGTSFVAYSLANIVSQLGYTVLLVDMDTEGRSQSYISKSNYDSMEPDGANLMSAINSSNGINTHISIAKQSFHLLTMGLATDTAPVNELLHKEKLSRFVNLAKSGHQFIIYDIPFKDATGYLSDITYMADNLVIVTDASNWGVTKTMLSVCNIGSDDMQDTIFSRAQLVFNRFRNLNRVLGKKVKTCVDITKVMDQKVMELIGEDPGFYFADLHIAGIINDDRDIENGWFEDIQYSDTKKGQEIFLSLIEHIVLKK